MVQVFERVDCHPGVIRLAPLPGRAHPLDHVAEVPFGLDAGGLRVRPVDLDRDPALDRIRHAIELVAEPCAEVDDRHGPVRADPDEVPEVARAAVDDVPGHVGADRFRLEPDHVLVVERHDAEPLLLAVRAVRLEALVAVRVGRLRMGLVPARHVPAHDQPADVEQEPGGEVVVLERDPAHERFVHAADRLDRVQARVLRPLERARHLRMVPARAGVEVDDGRRPDRGRRVEAAQLLARFRLDDGVGRQYQGIGRTVFACQLPAPVEGVSGVVVDAAVRCRDAVRVGPVRLGVDPLQPVRSADLFQHRAVGRAIRLCAAVVDADDVGIGQDPSSGL